MNGLPADAFNLFQLAGQTVGFALHAAILWAAVRHARQGTPGARLVAWSVGLGLVAGGFGWGLWLIMTFGGRWGLDVIVYDEHDPITQALSVLSAGFTLLGYLTTGLLLAGLWQGWQAWSRMPDDLRVRRARSRRRETPPRRIARRPGETGRAAGAPPAAVVAAGPRRAADGRGAGGRVGLIADPVRAPEWVQIAVFAAWWGGFGMACLGTFVCRGVNRAMSFLLIAAALTFTGGGMLQWW